MRPNDISIIYYMLMFMGIKTCEVAISFISHNRKKTKYRIVWHKLQLCFYALIDNA